MKKIRQIFFYKDYFLDFYNEQSPKTKEKILWTFRLVETSPRVPAEYLKHIKGTDGLYEIRVQLGRSIFRIFCFVDMGRLFVLVYGFQKLSQKKPRQNIDQAIKIIHKYVNDNIKYTHIQYSTSRTILTKNR